MLLGLCWLGAAEEARYQRADIGQSLGFGSLESQGAAVVDSGHDRRIVRDRVDARHLEQFFKIGTGELGQLGIVAVDDQTLRKIRGYPVQRISDQCQGADGSNA